MDLVALLKNHEGKTLEFKRDLSSPDKAIRTLVAFANTAGGILLIGVEDGTRRVRGITDPLALEERLANLISDTIEPRLMADLEILPWRRTHVLAAQIYPSPSRPHHMKSLGPETGVFIRVGSANRRADQTLVEELKRLNRNESFDETPMPSLSSEAIDFRVASESFSGVRRLRPSDLRTLRLTTLLHGQEVPTVGGILLFGKQREQLFPDAWIHAGRFAGQDRTRILDTLEIRAPLVQAVEEAIEFVKRQTPREAVIGEVRRSERWMFPAPAVREAVINAVVHADYSQRGAPIRISIFSDRMEVENPGLLPFGLTVEDVRRGISKLRNRVIGRVFHELGLIEQWGSGIGRMTAACREVGIDDPLLEEVATHFRVTISGIRRRQPAIDETSRAILRALSRGQGLSTQQIAIRIKKSPRATRTRLLSLVEDGLVVEVGTGPNDPRRRYHLARHGS